MFFIISQVILRQIAFLQKKYIISLLVALIGLVLVARPTFILLTHDFQAEADNAYFIYKHVKKRKQDFEEAPLPAILERMQLKIVKLPPVTPSRFIAARTQTALYLHPQVTVTAYSSISGTKTYLFTGKLSI